MPHRGDLAREQITCHGLRVERQIAQGGEQGLPQLVIGRQGFGLSLAGKRDIGNQRATRAASRVQPRQTVLDRW
ncbi:MAG: hypothetical protein LBB76_02610 [Azoarcus sp.]|nr:hypothetical protein [Azoarcus sp.]